MKKALVMVTLAVLALAAAGSVSAGERTAEVGAAAPDFQLMNQDGKPVKLSDSDGKIRVLEWLNPDCPFVKRHYKAKTMKRLAEVYGAKGVVWLTINSTHYMGQEDNAKFRKEHELPYPILTDADGTVGHLYDARTTPHMYIVDADGMLVYNGAIDDDPRGNKDGDPVNYVAKALDELIAGSEVSTPETKPYGCSVKYKN